MRQLIDMFKPVTQFSLFLVNKPGILSQVCDTLAEKKINLLAVTLMDSFEHGVLRLVASNPERAKTALRALNVPMTETSVICADMPNRPGALADLCSRLNSEHISIKYAYVTTGASGGRTTGIFKVDNMKRALKLSLAKKSRRKEKKAVRRNRAIQGH